MAHKVQVETVAGVPIAVVLKVAPRNWTFGPNPHGALKVGDPGPPLCFVSRDIEPSTVEWKGVKIAQPLPPVYLDARQLRDEFMSIRKKPEFQEFLNRVGAFSRLDEAERKMGWQMSDMIAFQSALRGLAVESPTKWDVYWQDFSSGANVGLGFKGAFGSLGDHSVRFHWHKDPQLAWRGSKNLAVIMEKDALSAILATIEIDHLRGAKFAVCALPDCPNFYEITSAHVRKYCSQYCAHLASVRRTRDKQKQKAKEAGSTSRKRSAPK